MDHMDNSFSLSFPGILINEQKEPSKEPISVRQDIYF